MDLSTALGFFGLLATVIFGALSIYVVIKHKYPGQITFIIEDCVGLFESIVKHFPELSVLYKEQPVGQGIVLLKGALVNTGSEDISAPMIEEQISLVLPEGFKWMQAKIVATSPSMQAIFVEAAQILKLETGLFRCKEYIKFECLAEAPIPATGSDKSIEGALLDALDVTHRIADTQKVSAIHLPPLDYSNSRFKKRSIMYLIIMLLGLVLLGAIFIKGTPGRLNFIITSEGGEKIEVRLKPKANGQVKLEGVAKKEFKKTIPVEAFFCQPGIVPKIVPENMERNLFLGVALIYILFPAYLLISRITANRKIRRLHALLK